MNEQYCKVCDDGPDHRRDCPVLLRNQILDEAIGAIQGYEHPPGRFLDALYTKDEMVRALEALKEVE